MSGRTKKIWQSIALLDTNPEIGVFKSKQIIRNEIYQKCAKIVDSYLGNAGSVSDNLKQAYYNDENTEQVNELKETIKKDIDLLIDSYANLLPKEIEIIKNECKNII
jgi:adenine-specific DNA methylase